MGKRKRDEDPKSRAEDVLSNDVKKASFEKSMFEHEVDEALACEQFIKDEVASKETLISERWTMLEQCGICALWMIQEEESSINHLSTIRDEMLMEEEFEKDRILIEEAFVKGYLPGWDDLDVMNYLLQYLEMEITKYWHWLERDEALDAIEVGEEYYQGWLYDHNSLTEKQLLMNIQQRVEWRLERAMIREQDIKSIEETKMEELVMMQEEVIMEDRLMTDELLIASEESMASQQDAINEQWVDYEQSIQDHMLIGHGQVGMYIIAVPKKEQPATFNYTPLTRPDVEIRVVRLHPSPRRRDAPIYCDLVTIDLRSDPVYEALSYEWGSLSSKKHTIRLNSKLFSVGENLWQALYNLRDSRAPRTLWIDALCIDQASVHEKNCQVSRMGDIYSQAARVVAWIGEDDHQARKCRAFLAELNSSSIERYCPPHGSCRRWEHTSKWAALSSLCTRSYWSRLWIIQEVLLALNLVIQCGSLSFSWDEVSNVFHYLRENSTGFCSPEPRNSIVSSIPFRLEYWRKEHRMAVFAGTKNDLVPLQYLVSLFKDSLCRDTRDKIFGLRSLSVACCKDFARPDYSLAYDDVFKTLMIHHDAVHAGPVNKHPFSDFLILVSKIQNVQSWI